MNGVTRNRFELGSMKIPEALRLKLNAHVKDSYLPPDASTITDEYIVDGSFPSHNCISYMYLGKHRGFSFDEINISSERDSIGNEVFSSDDLFILHGNRLYSGYKRSILASKVESAEYNLEHVRDTLNTELSDKLDNSLAEYNDIEIGGLIIGEYLKNVVNLHAYDELQDLVIFFFKNEMISEGTDNVVLKGFRKYPSNELFTQDDIQKQDALILNRNWEYVSLHGEIQNSVNFTDTERDELKSLGEWNVEVYGDADVNYTVKETFYKELQKCTKFIVDDVTTTTEVDTSFFSNNDIENDISTSSEEMTLFVYDYANLIHRVVPELPAIVSSKYLKTITTITSDSSDSEINGAYDSVVVSVDGDTILASNSEGVWKDGENIIPVQNISKIDMNNTGDCVVIVCEVTSTVYVYEKGIDDAWSQVGESISYPVKNAVISGISGPGNTIAISGMNQVRVYTQGQDTLIWSHEVIENGTVGFGTSLSLNDEGDTIAIGSPNEITSEGVDTGGVFVYTYTNSAWSLTGSIYGRAKNEEFGHSVSLNGNGDIVSVGSNGVCYPSKPCKKLNELIEDLENNTTPLPFDNLGHFSITTNSHVASEGLCYPHERLSDLYPDIFPKINVRAAVYHLIDDEWTALGQSIFMLKDDDSAEEFGISVSLSHGGRKILLTNGKGLFVESHVYLHNKWHLTAQAEHGNKPCVLSGNAQVILVHKLNTVEVCGETHSDTQVLNIDNLRSTCIELLNSTEIQKYPMSTTEYTNIDSDVSNKVFVNMVFKNAENITFTDCTFKGYVANCTFKNVRFENCRFGQSMENYTRGDFDTFKDDVNGYDITTYGLTPNTRRGVDYLRRYMIIAGAGGVMNEQVLFETEFRNNTFDNVTFGSCDLFCTNFVHSSSRTDHVHFDNCFLGMTTFTGGCVFNTDDKWNNEDEFHYFPVRVSYKNTKSYGTVLRGTSFAYSTMDNSLFELIVSICPIVNTYAYDTIDYPDLDFEIIPKLNTSSINIMRAVHIIGDVILDKCYIEIDISNNLDAHIFQAITSDAGSKLLLNLCTIPTTKTATLSKSFQNQHRSSVYILGTLSLKSVPNLVFKDIDIDTLRVQRNNDVFNSTDGLLDRLGSSNRDDSRLVLDTEQEESLQNFKLSIVNFDIHKDLFINDMKLQSLVMDSSAINSFKIENSEMYYLILQNIQSLGTLSPINSSFTEISLQNVQSCTLNIIQQVPYSISGSNCNSCTLNCSDALTSLILNRSDHLKLYATQTSDNTTSDNTNTISLITLTYCTVDEVDIRTTGIQNLNTDYTSIAKFNCTFPIDTLISSKSILTNVNVSNVSRFELRGLYEDNMYGVVNLTSENGVSLNRCFDSGAFNCDFKTGGDFNVIASEFNNSVFDQCVFNEVYVSNQNLKGVSFKQCTIPHVHLTNSTVENGTWSSSTPLNMTCEGMNSFDSCVVNYRLIKGVMGNTAFRDSRIALNVQDLEGDRLSFMKCKDMELHIEKGELTDGLKMSYCSGKYVKIHDTALSYLKSSNIYVKRFEVKQCTANYATMHSCSLNRVVLSRIKSGSFQFTNNDVDSMKWFNFNVNRILVNKSTIDESLFSSIKSSNFDIRNSRFRDHVSIGINATKGVIQYTNFQKVQWSDRNLNNIQVDKSIFRT